MNKRNKEIVGLAIRNARKNKSLTQSETAEKLGISRSYLSDLENGRYAPSSEKLLLLFMVLEIDINSIIKEINV